MRRDEEDDEARFWGACIGLAVLAVAALAWALAG